MMGGVDHNIQVSKWLTSLKTSFATNHTSSVASSTINNVIDITPIAKADSGATFHYLKPQHRKALTNVTELEHGPTATLPNNQTIQASCKGIIPFHGISKQASTALIYP